VKSIAKATGNSSRFLGSSLRPREAWLETFSHHVRQGTMITMGYVELLAGRLDERTLTRQVMRENSNGGSCTLQQILDKILASQERIVSALERLEEQGDK